MTIGRQLINVIRSDGQISRQKQRIRYYAHNRDARTLRKNHTRLSLLVLEES